MLTYELKDQRLELAGDLTYDTLNQLWQASFNFNQLKIIELSKVNKLDSAGLALLIHWRVCHAVALVGMDAKMNLLIELYDLNDVLNH